jgi:type III restriction enzyme
MLREGWDVRNVCVIVTLRPLSAANRILPEQALGRGLRRMTPPGSGFDERVVVIEHEAFRNLWNTELDGGLVVEKEDADKIQPGAVTIFPDEAKRRFDIIIPQLTRALARSDSALSQLHPNDVPDPKKQLAVPDVQPDEYVQYRGLHLIDKGVIEEYEFYVPYAEDPNGVITYYTRSVAKEAGVDRLSGAFATLVPMVRDYLKQRVFERPVELEDKVILRRLAENDAQALVVGAFRDAIRALSITEREPTIQENALRVSETPPFPWSRETVAGERTVFNLTPVDSSLEARFARFLDRASDVTAWAKLTMNTRFALEYISNAGALRYYYPDFVLRLSNDTCLIVETKGQEDLDVALKDRRARRWCQDSTRLAGREWAYEKVPQKLFDTFDGDSVEGLRRFLDASGTVTN